ncbi:transcriptional regulator, AraC family [Campylobacter iguaniorum]|uniref:helix-turn-helix domain-containing protein n=1 Tax=Campylobacter iguaniorum TaxID=1244531 RepID=UPI0007C9434C|nr:helix-turn-helix transcriptional regulator [Campylobacter iguaniorum]ANE35881.1 transcriptional regulator, AraC family [Campylobacter iguaniorum]
MNLPNNLLNKYQNISNDNLIFVKYKVEKSTLNYEVSFRQNAIIYVKTGQKIVITPKNKYTINQQELLFLPSTSHTLSDISKNGSYESWILFFSDEIIIKLLKKYNITTKPCQNNNKNISFIAKNNIIINLFESLNLYNSNLDVKEILDLKFEELFLYLVKSNNKEFISYINQIKRLNLLDFKSMFFEDFIYENVASMAKTAKMDISSFSRKFKLVFGKSPKEWLDDKRFELALQLVKNSNKNINQICLECGFSSPAWFIARFKAKFGTTPYKLKISNN